MRYKREENQIIIFADDTLPRFITASAMLDIDTVAVADKFGTVSIVRWEFKFFVFGEIYIAGVF